MVCLVVAVGADGDLFDPLMTLAERHLDRSAGGFEVEAGKGLDDLVGGRTLSAIGSLRLLPGRLQAEQVELSM